MLARTGQTSIFVTLLLTLGFPLSGPRIASALNGSWVSAASPAGGPGLRREHGSVFDRRNQRFLIFHGRGTNPQSAYLLFNDVWALDVSGSPSWAQMPVIGPPPGQRHSPQWGHDAARNRVLVFGGYGSHHPGSPFEYLNDVWELTLDGVPKWKELFPTGQTPTGRLAGASVYDPMRQRFVGFGGTINQPVDTWVLNLRNQPNWQPLPVAGEIPKGGWGMTSVYDARKDRMLIFGGSTGDGYYGSTNEVYELRLRGVPTWTKLTTSGARPAPRRSGAAIFDPIRNRMVIYGGFDAQPGSDAFLGDTWALDFDSSPPAWTELTPQGPLPSIRDAMSAGYDVFHDRMIVYGGWSGTQFLDDTQFLDWNQWSQDASMTAEATATPAAAHVEWEVDAATGTHAAIYRREPDGEWTALAEAEVDGAGQVSFDDATVVPGTEYDYMMVVGSERGDTFGGEASVLVPSALSVDPGRVANFALQRVAPNPAVDRMSISFVLPSSEPASLDLIDASGRRWVNREVGSLGAGSHRVELTTEGRIPAGLYFLRLAQADRVATRRVAIAAGH